jgi:hypothetical protein
VEIVAHTNWTKKGGAGHPSAYITFRRDPRVRRLLRDALDESGLAPRKGS